MGKYLSGSGAEGKQLSEAFGIRGRTPVSIAGEVSPVILTGPDAPPPYHTKRGGHFRLAASGDAVGPTPGTVALINPTSSGIVVVLRRITLYNQGAAAQSFRIGPFFAETGGGIVLTAANPPVHWDSEPSGTGIVGIQRPTARLGFSSVVAATLDPMELGTYPVDGHVIVSGPWVLREARGLSVQSVETGAAANIDASFYWDEFPIL